MGASTNIYLKRAPEKVSEIKVGYYASSVIALSGHRPKRVVPRDSSRLLKGMRVFIILKEVDV